MPQTGSGELLAVIPARGGSKGIPQKNLQDLGGQPLIGWAIEAALASRRVSRLIVSTEDDEIASRARVLGAEIPFVRPVELAQDHVETIPVILHAIDWIEANEHVRYEYVVLIQPTSPFVTGEDLDAAHRIAHDNRADSVVSVFASHHHPYWSKRISDGGRLEPFGPWGMGSSRRQDLPRAYALNGAIFLARVDVLKERQTWYTDKTFPYVMPAERSLDIDTPWDLEIARLVATRTPMGKG